MCKCVAQEGALVFLYGGGDGRGLCATGLQFKARYFGWFVVFVCVAFVFGCHDGWAYVS